MTITIIGIVLYFLPAIVAAVRRAHIGPVIVVNLLLGWTFLGWVVALAMACGKSERPSRPVVPCCHLCGLPLDPSPHVCGTSAAQPSVAAQPSIVDKLPGWPQTPAPMTWREAIGFPKKDWPGEDPEWIEPNQIERP